MKLLLPIEIHVAVCELKATQRRTDPLSQVDSYRTASFKYRCYVVCGTTALHWQASTPMQQLFFQTVFKKTYKIVVVTSESVVVYRYSSKVPP